MWILDVFGGIVVFWLGFLLGYQEKILHRIEAEREKRRMLEHSPEVFRAINQMTGGGVKRTPRDGHERR